jgi:hypothetical protein
MGYFLAYLAVLLLIFAFTHGAEIARKRQN